MRWLCLLAALAVGGTVLHAQCVTAPCIDSLQSGFVGGPATNGAAITAGTPTGENNAFWLYINGVFNPDATNTVTWTSTAAPAGAILSTFVGSSTSPLVVSVPNTLYAAQDLATITVTQTCAVAPCTATSNGATFTVNPAMAGLTLPVGVAGQAYSQPLASGGTGSYTIVAAGGALPPGMQGVYPTGSVQADTNFNGTPTTAGTYGFSMRITDAWANQSTFQYSLTIESPPTVTSVAPASCTVSTNATAGCTTGAFPLLVGGTNFFTGLTVFWDGGAIGGTVNSATQIAVAVPNSVLKAGTHFVSVGLPGGFSSNRLAFVVYLPPALTSLLPTPVTAGSPAFTMTLNGTGFLAGMVVQWQGPSGTSNLTPATLTATQITVTVPANLVATAGTASVAVLSTDTVPVASNPLSLTINGAPTVSSVLPASCTVSTNATAGCTTGALPIQIGGVNFFRGLVVNWDSTAIGGTVTSGTLVTASVPQNLLTTGTHFVSVATVEGVVSNRIAFVVNPAPVLTSLQPSPVTAGATAVSMTLNGANFLAGMKVQWQGLSGTSNLTPTAVTATQITVSVPATLVAAAGTASLAVLSADTVPVVSNSLSLTINAAPTVSSVVPGTCTVSTNATAGCTTGALPIQIGGANFFSGLAVVWDSTTIGGTLISTTQATVAVPHSLLTAGIHYVSVTAVGGVASNRIPFVVNPAPVLTGVQPSSIAMGTTPGPLTLSGANFLPGMVVQWQGPSGSSLLIPSSLSPTQITVLIPASLVTTIGPGTVTVLSGDPVPVTSNSLPLAVVTPPRAPLVITTGSPLSPPATVGVDYSNVFSASGGDTAGYSFALAGGALPSGVSLYSSGQLVGTPAAAGTFNFTVQVTDASNNTANKGFTLVVNPAPLTITTPPFATLPLGTPLNVTFAARGGTPPYVFSASGTLPPNAQFTSGGNLTATLSTAGTYSFTVKVVDSAQATTSQGYTITVSSTTLAITTTSPLPSGPVGAVYPGVQFQASGGAGGYTWSAGSTPPGLSFSASGALSGTPTTAGSYSISVTVTDSAKNTASGSFAITITGLTITTASLADGTVGTPYSAPNMTATGGTGGLTWTAGGLPAGISMSSAGAFSGTPTTAGAASVSVTVTDSTGATASHSYTLTVKVAPLSITPAGAVPAAAVGSSFSLGFSVAGGTPPYSFSAAGLPAGLSVSGGTGDISGAPTAAGTFNVTVTVKDSTGATAGTTFTLTPTLPTTPPLNLTGISSSVNPGSQSNVGVGLGSPYPVDVTVTLTLTFSGNDPAVQFSTGGATATITVPAGQTAGLTTVGVQTGTVAGTITITAHLSAGGQDITPSPAPTSTITVPATAPVISTVTATRNSTGFTVTIVGYSSTLALTTANFTFTGSNLGTTTLSIPVSTIFATWYQSSAAGQFGSNFTYTQPFTTSNPQSVTSLTVTLVNSVGTSASASANLQ